MRASVSMAITRRRPGGALQAAGEDVTHVELAGDLGQPATGVSRPSCMNGTTRRSGTPDRAGTISAKNPWGNETVVRRAREILERQHGDGRLRRVRREAHRRTAALRTRSQYQASSTGKNGEQCGDGAARNRDQLVGAVVEQAEFGVGQQDAAASNSSTIRYALTARRTPLPRALAVAPDPLAPCAAMSLPA